MSRDKTRCAHLRAIPLPVLLMAGHITVDGFSGMLPALLPTLALRYSLPEGALAGLVATLSVSSMAQPALGALADRVGRRTVAVLGVSTTAIFLSLVAVAPTTLATFAFALFGGLGSAAFHPAGTSIVRAMRERFKDLSVAVFSGAGTIGMALGPLIILTMVRTVGIRFSPALMLPAIVLAGVLAFSGSSAPTPRFRNGSTRRLLGTLLRSRVGVLSLVGTLRSLAFVSFLNGMPLWLTEGHRLSASSPVIAWTLALFDISGGVGGVVAAWLAGFVPRRTLVVVSMVLALPSLVGTVLVTTGGAAYYALVAVAGATANAALPLLVVGAQDLAPESMGAASGMLMGFTWGMGGVAYLAIGALEQGIGLAPALVLAYAALIPASVLAFLALTGGRGDKQRQALANPQPGSRL